MEAMDAVLQNTHTAAAAKSLQSCLTLCDPRDGSPPGSPIPGILQPRTLQWVAIAFSENTHDIHVISAASQTLFLGTQAVNHSEFSALRT